MYVSICMYVCMYDVCKNPPLNRPSKYFYLKIALKYNVKQSKNGKFSSNCNLG